MRPMVVRARLALALAPLVMGVLASAPSAARAQETPPAATPAPPPPGGGEAPPAGSAPEAKPKSTAPAGYAYGDKPAPRSRPVKGVKPHAKGPVATYPGFQTLEDGGTRVFVQLTEPVQVEERKAKGSLTYVLKGAHVAKRNNTNALVTVHFDTPVSRARLVPAGNDLHFVVELRAAATPAWSVKEGPEKSSMLVVDFPKGDYLPKDAPAASEAPAKPGAPAPPGQAGQPDENAGGAGPTP